MQKLFFDLFIDFFESILEIYEKISIKLIKRSSKIHNEIDLYHLFTYEIFVEKLALKN